MFRCSKVRQDMGLWPHISGRLMKDRWADSGQCTFGLIDSLAPEGSIICHPPWDLSVQQEQLSGLNYESLAMSGGIRLPYLHQHCCQKPRGSNAHPHSHCLPLSLIYLLTQTHIYTCTHMYILVFAPMNAGIFVSMNCNESRLIVPPTESFASVDTFVGAGIWLTKHTPAAITILSEDFIYTICCSISRIVLVKK